MDKRDHILKAALKLFVTFGFHGTPTSKIAQVAGVANGTLFHYFSTKDKLIIELYADIKTRLNDYILNQIKFESELDKVMKGHFLASLYWALDNYEEFKFIELFNNSPYLLMIAPEEVEKQTKPHLDLLRNAIEAKIIKNLPVDFLYVLISSHIYGVNQYLTKENLSKVEQHQLINQSFELIWNMIS